MCTTDVTRTVLFGIDKVAAGAGAGVGHGVSAGAFAKGKCVSTAPDRMLLTGFEHATHGCCTVLRFSDSNMVRSTMLLDGSHACWLEANIHVRVIQIRTSQVSLL